MDSTFLLIVILLGICSCSSALGGSGVFAFFQGSSPTKILKSIVNFFLGALGGPFDKLLPCSPTKKIKESCARNCDCINGACGHITAADGAALACCPSGATTSFGLRDYCSDMPDGSVCWSDAMCETKFCRDNNGGTRKGVCGRLKDGASCPGGKDNQCENGACGLSSGDNNAKYICCPSNKTTRWGFKDYCTNLESGKACKNDKMCASGLCQDGKCVDPKSSGQSCPGGADKQCKNGACGYESNDSGAKHICCPSGKTVRIGIYDYCTERPAGTGCRRDSVCASGLCKGGKCFQPKDAGQACPGGSDSQCKNGACGYESNDRGAKHICCPSGKTQRIGIYDYCTERPVGTGCRRDSVCASGLCKGGKCFELKGAGQSCPGGLDNQCKNGACGYESNESGAKQICCPSGKTQRIGIYDYCTNRPKGTGCRRDSVCASGWCDSGKCRNKLSKGATCSSDSQCASKNCVGDRLIKKGKCS